MSMLKHKNRLAALILTAGMLVQPLSGVAVNAETAESEAGKTVDDTSYTLNSLADMKDLMVSINYEQYLSEHENVPDAKKEIVIDVADYNKELSKGEITVNNNDTVVRDGKEVKASTVTTTDEGRLIYDVDIPEEAMYSVTVEYYPVEGNGATIERILLIDEKIPFSEARYMNFSRIWKDIEEKGYSREARTFKVDINRNEMRPVKTEAPEWCTLTLSDSQMFYVEPFKFCLGEGKHTIGFESASEPLKIASIKLHAVEPIMTYEEYLEKYKNVPDADTDEIVMIHAETPLTTSEQVIYAMNDRTSAITIPQATDATLLNTIGGNGGDKWKTQGQWIEWTFEVPETGMYYIVPRFKQTINAGLFSSRKLYIDGEVPFLEANDLQFKYSSDWQTECLNDGDTKFKFYLEKGTHKIKLEVALGKMAEILRTISASTDRLNGYYRKILMITGSDPDQYTDYQFSKLIPDVLRGMREESAKLKEVSAQFEQTIGGKGENTVILDRVSYLLDIMGKDQDKIASSLANYKSYIGSLGTWLLSTKAQPLQLDYIVVQSASNDKMPKAEAGFFESVAHEVKSFIMSFFVDYNSMGASTKYDKDNPNAIEVWITDGRDQATIMRQMVDDSFTAQYGISVNLKLIAAGTLLPATLAGSGPDVSMDLDPVGYGIRNAVIPLNYFENTNKYMGEEILGFSDVKAKYFDNNEEFFVPLTVLDPDRREFVGKEYPIYDDDDAEFAVVNGVERNGVVTYGLPSRLDFPMLFYRKDVFTEMGLEVPQTWDDVETMIRALSEGQLEMGFAQTLAQIRMYQTGEEWYKSCYDYEDYEGEKDLQSREYLRTVGIQTNLDSNGALDAFQRMTEWFTLYGQPIAYDFANRFRTGELPIAIQSYTLYNQLKVFAPEISGLWEFVQLPGVEQEDGTINHNSPITITSIMMMRNAADDLKPGQDVTESQRAQNAWKYMQWWVGTEAQERFGKEQVAIMGTAAKYNSANVEALKGQSWTAQEKKNLNQQFKSLKGTPMSPGNYIVARYTNFAFYKVVDEDEVASEAMLGYVDDINNELTRKRKEYGFLTLDEYKEQLEAKGIGKKTDSE
jgi:ABC-type glycerol-3-phosphate transport system substrate-binding protein